MMAHVCAKKVAHAGLPEGFGTGFSKSFFWKERFFENAFIFRVFSFTVQWNSNNGWFENVSNSV